MKIQNIDIPYNKVEYRNYKEFSLRFIISSSLTKCLTTEQKEDLCFHRAPILDRPPWTGGLRVRKQLKSGLDTEIIKGVGLGLLYQVVPPWLTTY